MLAPERSAPALEESYRACRDVVRLHSKTFYASSLFLAPEKRRAVWAVYAFCRTADDIVDRVAPAGERLAAIEAWERRLIEAYDGGADGAVFTAFADAARRYAIPIEPALDLLRGARMDVTVRRYESYDDVREYCYLVAATVGLLVMPIMGTTSSRAAGYGVVLGLAMQLTNILRDVGEDARMGRIYLPQDELRRFGCSEATILAELVDEPFIALMRFQIARVRSLYAQSEPGIAMLAPDSRYAVRFALHLYRGILARIEANRYDVFTRRAYVPFRTKMLMALTSALMR